MRNMQSATHKAILNLRGRFINDIMKNEYGGNRAATVDAVVKFQDRTLELIAKLCDKTEVNPECLENIAAQIRVINKWGR